MKELHELPDDWYVYRIDPEADPPFLVAFMDAKPGGTPEQKETFELPGPLAYYLKTHWSGTDAMETERSNRIEELVREDMIVQVRRTLGIDLDPPPALATPDTKARSEKDLRWLARWSALIKLSFSKSRRKKTRSQS